jgi:hypothetical protein
MEEWVREIVMTLNDDGQSQYSPVSIYQIKSTVFSYGNLTKLEFMKKHLTLLILCLAAIACDTNSHVAPSVHSILGFWSRETVYLNGVNSIEYVHFLNNGNNFLDIKKDKTFERAYDIGNWDLSDLTLTLDRKESAGLGDWKYTIIEHSTDNLILELKLN